MNNIVAPRLLQRLIPAATKPARAKLHRTPHMLALEQRFMFDGAAAADAAHAAHAAADPAVLAHIPDVPPAVEVRAADPSKTDQKKEVVIVDTSVADYKTLEAGIQDGIGIVEIDGSKDGLAQIAKWAETQSGYDSISILSHGGDGALHLGSTILTDSSLSDAQVQAELAELGHALNAGGDVLLYGCDIAADHNGTAFVNDFAQATGADVAASSDLTGAAAMGGNWTLEYHTGTIDTPSLDIADYQHILAGEPTTTVTDAALSSDSGAQNNDFVTNVAAQTISGHLSTNLAAGESVQVSFDGGNNWINASNYSVGSNDWSVNTTLFGGNTFEARVTNANGSSTPFVHTYTLDTTPPTKSVVSAALSNDSAPNGAHNTDFITNAAAQTISGALSSNLLSGETVYVSLDNGSTWIAATASVGSNIWSLAGVTLTSSNTLKVKVSDTAGNDSAVLSQAYVYDTTAPTTTFSGLALSADTGSSNSDFITKTAAQTISATLSNTLTGGDSVWGSLDNGTTWTDITNKVSGTSLSWNGVTLAGGNTLLLRVTDAAGNDGPVKSQAYVLDNTAPTTPGTPVLASASDTGTSNSDGITSNVNPTFTGTAEAGSTVSVFDGATLLGTTIATVGGTWSDTTATLSEGSHSITVTATDTAGNVSAASGARSIMIDTTAPAVTSVSVPANGTYPNGQPLDFTVNFNEAVTVDTTGGTPRIAIVVGSTMRFADYVSGSGTGALTFRYVVPNGDVDTDGITVGALSANGGTLKDTAGNNAVTTLNSVGSTTGVNVDGTQPAVTGVGASTADGAYGAGQTITITVDFSSAVTVDTSGGTPMLALDGGGSATYIGGSGSSTLTFSYVVGAGQNSADLDYSASTALSLNGATIVNVGGSHQPVALSLATPGTAGSLGASKNIVIDTTAPTNTVTGAAFSADTGTSNSDLITKTAAQTISGTLSANLAADESVYVSLDNGATWALATTSVGANSWSLAGQTLSGSNTLQVRVSDAAGNNGAVFSHTYVLDTTAPTTTFSNIAFSADNGSSNSDLITNTAAQTISATLSNAPATGDVVYGSLDNGASWTDITSKVSGTTLTWNGVTLTASDTLQLRVTDAAGNNGSPTSHAYVLDTTAPTVTFSNVALSADTGVSNTDFITDTAAQTITATLSGAPAGGDVVYGSLDNGVTWVNITAKVAGTTLTWDSVTLPAGSSTLMFKVQDLAGNDGPILSTNYTYTPPPTPVASAASQLPTLPPLVVALNTPIAPTSVIAPADLSSVEGFQVVPHAVFPSDSPISDPFIFDPSVKQTTIDTLAANAPLSDMVLGAGQQLSFKVPTDTFVDAAGATVNLSATASDGRPLPGWLSFNAKTGTFEGTPPPGFHGVVAIKVMARDSRGNNATQIFKITVGAPAPSAMRQSFSGQPSGSEQPAHAAAAGRSGLSQQLHASRNGDNDRLAALARSVKVATTGHA